MSVSSWLLLACRTATVRRPASVGVLRPSPSGDRQAGRPRVQASVHGEQCTELMHGEQSRRSALCDTGRGASAAPLGRACPARPCEGRSFCTLTGGGDWGLKRRLRHRPCLQSCRAPCYRACLLLSFRVPISVQPRVPAVPCLCLCPASPAAGALEREPSHSPSFLPPSYPAFL